MVLESHSSDEVVPIANTETVTTNEGATTRTAMNQVQTKMMFFMRKINGTNPNPQFIASRESIRMSMSVESHRPTSTTVQEDFLYADEPQSDLAWFTISQEHKAQLGKNWLIFFLCL